MSIKREKMQLLIEWYTPLDEVVLPFARKALKAMTGVDLCTYIVMEFFFRSVMSSYS
jgi:hypothetical protein